MRLLAPSPACFAKSGDVGQSSFESRPEYKFTYKGFAISLRLHDAKLVSFVDGNAPPALAQFSDDAGRGNIYAAGLNCSHRNGTRPITLLLLARPRKDCYVCWRPSKSIVTFDYLPPTHANMKQVFVLQEPHDALGLIAEEVAGPDIDLVLRTTSDFELMCYMQFRLNRVAFDFDTPTRYLPIEPLSELSKNSVEEIEFTPLEDKVSGRIRKHMILKRTPGHLTQLAPIPRLSDQVCRVLVSFYVRAPTSRSALVRVRLLVTAIWEKATLKQNLALRLLHYDDPRELVKSDILDTMSRDGALIYRLVGTQMDLIGQTAADTATIDVAHSEGQAKVTVRCIPMAISRTDFMYNPERAKFCIEFGVQSVSEIGSSNVNVVDVQTE